MAVMIKVPVTVGSVGASNYHTSSCYPLLFDANFKPLSNEGAKEAAKRINMHDELVAAVKELKAFYDDRMASNKECQISEEIDELLERCK